MNAEWQSRYDLAVTVAQQAAKMALRFFPDTLSANFARHVDSKPDASPVTNADREAELHLRSSLLGRFGNDGFLGEEFGEIIGSSGFRWIVDPIDGTRSFVRGIPLWATLVGLEYRDEMIAGVIVEPVFGNTYRALRGDGSYKNDKRIHISNVDLLKNAILGTSDFNSFDQAGHADIYEEMSRQVQKQRGYGDYFGFVLVAQGSIEMMLDYGVHPWDVAAIIPIIEEAGGIMTAWDGKMPLNRPDVLASNGLLHSAALEWLQTKGTPKNTAATS
jgi:histidinol-phosphatase